ncbi:MAG TPA: hypothetical protein VKU19_27715 [Bryobacteraceae bacterium]|nr:hypothetical protein [Bryobacteraceae bacterium]
MLLYVLECGIAFVILLLGITEVVVPLIQGKAVFPMLNRKDEQFHARLDEIEQELVRSKRMDEIEREVGGFFESRTEIQPEARPSEKQKEKE